MARGRGRGRPVLGRRCRGRQPGAAAAGSAGGLQLAGGLQPEHGPAGRPAGAAARPVRQHAHLPVDGHGSDGPLQCSCVAAKSRAPRAAAAGPSDLHPLPDARAGEGVPHEPLPDAPAADRDGAPALPHRAPDQDLVPEPAHEAQEGNPSHQGAQRAGEAVTSDQDGGSGGEAGGAAAGAAAAAAAAAAATATAAAAAAAAAAAGGRVSIGSTARRRRTCAGDAAHRPRPVRIASHCQPADGRQANTALDRRLSWEGAVPT